MELIPPLLTGSGSFKLTEFHLFNLCRSLPAARHADVVQFVLENVVGNYKASTGMNRQLFLEDFPKMYMFLKKSSNDVCFSAFESFFSKNVMLKNYKDNDRDGYKVILFDLLSEKNYSIAKEMALAIKASKADPHDLQMQSLSQVLVTRQMHATLNGMDCRVANDNSESGRDSDSNEKSEDEQQDSEQNKILPLFAALEQSKIDLAISLRFGEEHCPPDKL